MAAFGAEVVQSSRDWLQTTFRSERVHGLLAPWVLHTGLGPDAAASGFMTRVIAFAIEAGGMPVPRGGGARLVDALVRLIEDNGGACETARDVERVVVENGRAKGVRLTSGDVVTAERAVVCNVTPPQLYGRLLADGDVPSTVREAGLRFRFGRSEMQIHFALSEPPTWNGDEQLGRTAIVHVTPGLDGVSRAVNEAERGLLPAEATIVVGQPLTVDESRAPTGSGLLWIQLQELPWRVKGDAAGEIDVGDGTWTESLRERYADRIQARLARHIPNLESSILGRVVLVARRPPGGEHQPGAGRSLLGLARPRPELRLAAVRAAARSPDTHPGAVPHRRQHLARSRARRGLRHARGRGAAPAAGRRACRPTVAGTRASRTSVESPGSCHVFRSRR